MIKDVTDWIVGRLRGIKLGGVVIPVYPPGPDRPKGEMADPHIAVKITDWAIDKELYRPAVKQFIPSDEQATVMAPAELGYLLHAEVTGTAAGPFAIEEGVNDSLLLQVGIEGGWVDPVAATLMPGSRDAWEIARAVQFRTADIAGEGTDDGKLRLWTAHPGMDLAILECPNSAYATLGLTVGVTSHLTQTGPASYGVAEAPVPLILEYTILIGTTDPNQQRSIEFWILRAIKDGHWPQIKADLAPTFEVNKVRLDEEGAIPDYETAIRYVVRQVWLEYPADFEVLGITGISELDLAVGA